MNIKTNELTGKNSDLLTTEIMYHIASAKSLGFDLVRFDIICDSSETERRVATVGKILKSAKRNGYIQLFVLSDDFDNGSTEVEYMKNKYPDLLNDVSDENFYIVKI